LYTQQEYNYKHIVFLSDFHLGTPNAEASLQREKKIVAFLNQLPNTVDAVFIMGDMFDFWYEYSTVVPKGYMRLFGCLAQLSDKGVALHFFVGNHDMWVKQYFTQQLNMKVYFEPTTANCQGKKIFLGHGDGLGPGDKGYKIMKKFFRSTICQFLFGLVPPIIGVGFANYLSRRSRTATGDSDAVFLGEQNEWLVQYCKKKLEAQHFDFFVFGHRHLPLNIQLSTQSTYINLGDWIKYDTFAQMQNGQITLHEYKPIEKN
jgi:UDP-2,3-diacylglucosamine hydrolase